MMLTHILIGQLWLYDQCVQDDETCLSFYAWYKVCSFKTYDYGIDDKYKRFKATTVNEEDKDQEPIEVDKKRT